MFKKNEQCLLLQSKSTHESGSGNRAAKTKSSLMIFDLNIMDNEEKLTDEAEACVKVTKTYDSLDNYVANTVFLSWNF